MAKTRLAVPEHFIFSANIPIRITDINYGGHVGNDAILSLIHEARMQMLQQFGFTELQFSGVSLIMSEATIEFKNEVFYGDTTTVFVTVADFSRAGFNVYYKLVKRTEANELVVAFARTTMLCYDYNQKKVKSIPEEARQIFKR